jgi:[ribosomal protein S5]-alanine N-acetyltransferase
MILATRRCHLKPWPQEAWVEFHALNASRYVRRFLWDDEVISEETAREILVENERLFSTQGYGIWQMIGRQSEALLGYVGLWSFFAEPQPQLIYALNGEYAGQGLATECAAQVVQYAFQKLNFPYLLASTDAGHLASQQVAIRLGMQLMEKRTVDGRETWFYRLDRAGYSD